MNSSSNAKRLVLLVDDDALLLEFLSEVLGHAGYETTTAASAAEAIRKVEAREPDMALLDITMPGMSGLELARHLHENTAVPFMFLSASGDAESARQAASSGAVGFVVKPVDAARLMAAFESGLARADEIRQLRRTEANLNAALAAGRETSLAVGLLMGRFQADRNTAFEVLRDHARSSRRKINEVADQLLAAEEVLNSLHAGFASRLKSK
ncbi:response regulator [Massilia sp. R2A-15]|uniref:ANTAR domain-containing response regulator n=1 Tax=Massilia sp. R2A-15 TaxID=3064278 RepID=UPI002732CD8E|nr:response regulator [Massilia sp. R2A-15]WLI89756.1 response regulator [Massilia sp. R2A-15]